VVTGAVNGGDTINYTLATTLNSLMLGLSYCCDFRTNPNYSVVSTNGILSVTPKSIAVTVIADGKSKYTGMKILRLLLWLLVLSMAAIPSTIP
jgi:hypothetical protein